MKQSSRLYVWILGLLTLLTAISGILSDVAAADLPPWFEPLRPWVWPVFGLLVVVTVVLMIFQARLEVSRSGTPQSQPIHVHVEARHPSTSPEFPEDVAADAKPRIYHNLPHPDYGVFVGRQKELAQIHRILRPYPHSQEHLVTIDGVGGVGKSALALEVVHRYRRDCDRLPEAERFEAIIWTSAKASVLTANGMVARPQVTHTLEDIYTAIAITLEREDITRASLEERAGLVTRALTRQRTLLIVDNLETIDDEQVNTFLRDLPAPTKAIVTTRHRMNVAYPVRLVGMPWREAKEIITRECKRQDVVLTQTEMRQLYERTGGVPLALVWSVAQMGYGYSVRQVITRLGNPQGPIARFCFEGSIGRIKGRPAHQLLQALAVFATDASREALGFVAGLSEDMLSRDEGLVELEKLSLVNRKEGRFSLLPLTKAYAASLSADEQMFRERQEKFYLDFCYRHGGSTENWSSYAKLDIDRENLIELLEWCLYNRRWQTLIDLQDRLMDYWQLRGYWSEQERWCEHAIEACSELAVGSPLSTGRQREKGAFHSALCWVRLNQDKFDDARTQANKAVEILKPIEDWHGVAVAYRRLGLTEKLNGEFDQDRQNLGHAKEHFDRAKRHYEAALEIWRRLDNPRETSSILANMGHLLIAQGRHSEARAFLEEALVIRREIGDVSRVSTTLRGLGLIDELEGKFDSATKYYLEALDIAEDVGDIQSIGEAKLGLAAVSAHQHQCLEALRLAREAKEHFLSLNETAFLRKDIAKAEGIISFATQRTKKRNR